MIVSSNSERAKYGINVTSKCIGKPSAAIFDQNFSEINFIVKLWVIIRY
jgi:hypothetical protein